VKRSCPRFFQATLALKVNIPIWFLLAVAAIIPSVLILDLAAGVCGGWTVFLQGMRIEWNKEMFRRLTRQNYDF